VWVLLLAGGGLWEMFRVVALKKGRASANWFRLRLGSPRSVSRHSRKRPLWCAPRRPSIWEDAGLSWGAASGWRTRWWRCLFLACAAEKGPRVV